jgi:hypothetical protein
MRLTLRTLLAWLDDTLPPTQVRDIGRQVAESPYAQELVDRIHLVTRQRRLTVPSKSGPDATDPNVVASFVDNDLEPDQVAEYEKKCLTSDVNLAEAASVHQILSLLGQKVHVPPEAKARMYQLVKGRETIPPPKADGAKPRVPEPVTKPIQPWVAPEPPRRHWLERFGPGLACLVLIAILSWSAYESLTPTKLETSIVENPPATEPAPTPETQVQEAAAEPAPPAADGEAGRGETRGPMAPEIPKEPLAAGKEGAASASATGGTGAAKTAETAGKSKSAPEEKGRARDVPAGAVGVVEKADGVLLRFSTEKREWERIAEGTSLGATDRLLCLAPFRARVVLGKMPITLIGETQVRLLTKDPGSDPAFELQTGRVLLDGSAPSGGLSVEFAGRKVGIEHPSGSSLGLERANSWRYAQPASQAPPLAILAAGGEQKLTLDQARQTLSGPGTILADSSGKFQARPGKALPAWMTETEPSPKDQKLGEEFLKQFSADRPVLSDIVVATESESPVMKKLAIYAVKALGDLSFLFPILSRPNDPDARQSTIAALRDYLAQGPAAERSLREQLREEFDEKTGPLIEKLLIGYSKEDASKGDALVDLLSPRNPSLPVRELVLDNLKALTGRGDLGYDPEHPDEKGYNAWKAVLKEGDLKSSPKRKGVR